MRISKRIISQAAVVAVLCFAFSALAAQPKKPEDVFTVKNGAWVLSSGGEATGLNGEDSEKGLWWYAVNPEKEDAAKGLKQGILFYDANAEKGKAYSFLPTTEEQAYVLQVVFSPDKKLMVVICKQGRYSSQLSVYDVKTLKSKESFMGHSDAWFVDNARFAFTMLDGSVERPPQGGLWGTSAVLYDHTAKDGYVVLKGATATESFTVNDANANKVVITVTSVKSEGDWKDEDKQQDSEITVDVPPAG